MAICTTATAAVVLMLLILNDVVSCVSNGRNAAFVIRPPRSGNDRHTMFLPLLPANRNLTRRSYSSHGGAYRRFLQKSEESSRANARMGLHDDLLLNGYYTTRLWIGTPPQMYALIVDTGSTVTYVPCSNCEHCGPHQDPKFDPETSSSYNPVKCNIDCNCDSDKKQCVYERQYAEMSSSSGVLGEDIISFGNQSELSPQRAVFGCETMETGDLYNQHADGIMGLGRGDLSVVDQLVEKGVISDSFSLCYGGMDFGGGAMVLGGISTPADMVYAYSDPVRSPYYNIELKEMHVAGKKLPLNPNVFDGKHGTVLDSGTTYAYLPEAAYSAFKDAMTKELHSLQQIRGPDPGYNDICFSGAGSEVSKLSETFPVVEMVFGNGQKLLLSPENYLFRHSKVSGAYCLGIFQNGKDPTTLLGGIIVRNTLVMYDREHDKIGFWKTNCSEVWERLNNPGSPPPAPTDMDRENATANVPPTLAPVAPPQYVPSGETKVGLITFYLSTNIEYSDLKYRITELTQLIAQELMVNFSQVNLLNFTSNGNDSITRWSVSPAGSADFMANTTAADIIARIAENRVNLPQTFGNYHLYGWQTELPPKRTSWRLHYLVAVVVGIVILVVGLSAFGAWFIWRRRDQSIPYKPVDSAVAEQELQPL